MRAAPRHLVDSRDRVRSVPAVRDKELIEQLNRQQQLLQQQREERRRFLEGQKVHDLSLYKDGRLSREEVTQIKNQLNVSKTYNGRDESGILSPRSEVGLKSGADTPAMDQILREGRVSVQSGRQSKRSYGAGQVSENSVKPSEHSDIFDTNRFEAEGLFQYEEKSDKKDTEKEIISDFQQLQTS